jgi:hypothetical protein
MAIGDTALAGGDLGQSGGVAGGDDSSGLSAGTLGLGALGVGGLAYMMGKGPSQVSSIPYFAQAQGQVPELQGRSALDWNQGQALVRQAGDAYGMAQRGELTPEQAAQNKILTTSEENQARQMYASMGRDYNRDTSAISTQQQIDLNATARAQAFIQSTIALATSQMGAGQSLLGLSLNESNAATNILMQEGQAQIQLNKQYSDSLSSAFKAIGTVFGAVVGGVAGGPAGAMAGATIGSKL